MITRIEAYRYRCFEQLAVALGNYQVLVGKNGAGKSTFIDIPVFLGEMLQRQSAHDAFFRPTASHPRARADGALDLVFNRTGSWFGFALEAALPNEIGAKAGASNVRYELAFSVEGSSLELSAEAIILFNERPAFADLISGLWSESRNVESPRIRLALHRQRGGLTQVWRESRQRGRRPEPVTFEAATKAPALSFLPPDAELYPAGNWLRTLLMRDCICYLPDLARLRNAQASPGREFAVAPDGSTLPWSVLQLSADADRFEEWTMHVQSALPKVARIEARQREDDGFAYLRLHYDNGPAVPSHGLSDGTLSILALSILPFLSKVPVILAVEEPENGIHPKAIETVVESLSKMPRSQVFVTTHSPIVVAVTPPELLLCLRQTKTAGVEVTPGNNHPQLVEWQGTPSIATLFSAGVL